MATNSENPKPKKLFLFGKVLSLKGFFPNEIEALLQSHIDMWLSYESATPKLTVQVTEIERYKEYRIDIHRVYGDWYRFCVSSTQNTTIFCWDEQILLGDGYQLFGTADFETHNGHYIIYHDVDDFAKSYNKAAKKAGGSSARELRYEQIDRDNIAVTILF